MSKQIFSHKTDSGSRFYFVSINGLPYTFTIRQTLILVDELSMKTLVKNHNGQSVASSLFAYKEFSANESLEELSETSYANIIAINPNNVTKLHNPSKSNVLLALSLNPNILYEFNDYKDSPEAHLTIANSSNLYVFMLKEKFPYSVVKNAVEANVKYLKYCSDVTWETLDELANRDVQVFDKYKLFSTIYNDVPKGKDYIKSRMFTNPDIIETIPSHLESNLILSKDITFYREFLKDHVYGLDQVENIFKYHTQSNQKGFFKKILNFFK